MHTLRLIIASLALACFAPTLSASSYSSVVVYGDSLSDNGNLFTASGGTFPAPLILTVAARTARSPWNTWPSR